MAVLAVCWVCDAERVVVVLPSCAKMIPSAGNAEVREVKALLLNDADAIEWRCTKWDIDMVMSADTFVSIGLPEEGRLIAEVMDAKPSLKIVNVGVGLRKIDGNPYFFLSSDNMAEIKTNIQKAFNYEETIVCGSPQKISSLMRPHFADRSYVVAISHLSFQYECESCGVTTVLVDLDRLQNKGGYRKEIIDRLKKSRANILLSLPDQARVPYEFLIEARLRKVEFDVFGSGFRRLPGVLFDNMIRRDSDIAKCEEREKSQASVLLKAIMFNRFEVPADATVQDAIDNLQFAINASDSIDLPKEKRKLKLDFSLAPEVKDDVLGHIVFENVTGLEVFSNICAKRNCRFAECSHETCTGEDFGILYVIRDSVDAQHGTMEDVE